MIAIGATIGANLRHALGLWLANLPFGFPAGTLIANLLDCFLIGLCATWGKLREVFTLKTRLLLFTGFFGSLTTFSTFGFEAFTLFGRDDNILPFIHLAAHLLLGLFLIWLGTITARMLWG